MYKYNTMNTLNIAENTFYEKINVAKLNFILNNQSQFEDIIKEQEKDMRRTTKTALRRRQHSELRRDNTSHRCRRTQQRV